MRKIHEKKYLKKILLFLIEVKNSEHTEFNHIYIYTPVLGRK